MTWSVSILSMAFQGEHAAEAATTLPILHTEWAHSQTAAPRAQAPDFQDWLPLDFMGAQPSPSLNLTIISEAFLENTLQIRNKTGPTYSSPSTHPPP